MVCQEKKIQHSWNLHLYILISFDMYINLLDFYLYFFSSVQFFRAGIMCFMSHFQRNGKHRIFISSSLPLVSWKLAVFAKFFFLLIILIGFFLMICLYILLTGNVYITWLDDVSAFVSLYKKDQSATGIYTHVLVYNFEKGGGKLTI